MSSDKKSGVRTMEEFSRVVGVSRPTISKYFSDPTTVRSSTRQRIEQAIEDLNFRPNMLAINLNRQRTNFIGVVIPDASDPFFASLVQNVIRAARTEGFITVTLTSDGDLNQEQDVIATLASLKVAGLIIIPSSSERSAQDYEAFVEGTPIVFVDSEVEGARHFVGTDNARSIGKMVRYLIRTGTAPCFFPMPPVNTNARLRNEAYCEVMREHGLPAEIVHTEPAQSWDFESFAYDETRRILAGPGFPSTTILCANDRLAYGMMAACHDHGLSIGNKAGADLRIAGHDDHPFAKYSHPSLTTVRQDVQSISMKAIKLLLTLIDGEHYSKRIDLYCDTEIEMRGSA